MLFQPKSEHDAATSTSIELQETKLGDGGVTPPHDMWHSEEDRKADNEDYAHMARLGKRQQFDVRANLNLSQQWKFNGAIAKLPAPLNNRIQCCCTERLDLCAKV